MQENVAAQFMPKQNRTRRWTLCLRRCSASNFLPFARKALRELDGVRLGDEAYLEYLAHELDQFAKGDTYRLIINLPPGHLKTSLGSVCLAAWLLGQDPSLKLMVVSHSEHLSKSIARKIRSLLQSPLFKGLFKTRITKGHAEVTDFGTASGGGVFVTSFRPASLAGAPTSLLSTIRTTSLTTLSRSRRRSKNSTPCSYPD